METQTTTTGAARGGGRGARERILRAAGELFYARGIHATGVAALIEAAHVSPRTFYVHFPTKNALVEEYLRRFETETPLLAETELERGDLTPVQRLSAIFAPIDGGPAAVIRGCPFHNAVVEGAGELPEIAHLAQRHKQSTRRPWAGNWPCSSRAPTRSRPPATTRRPSRTPGKRPRRCWTWR
jgi:AcrR family transcriptional regulator